MCPFCEKKIVPFCCLATYVFIIGTPFNEKGFVKEFGKRAD